MNVEEWKETALFKALKEDKKFQKAISKLGVTPEWQELKAFIVKYKQRLLEEMFDTNDLQVIQKYKNQILASERIVQLPDAIKFINEVAREDEVKKDEVKREAQRRKFNPGAIWGTVTSTWKGGDYE